ncbi:MAG: hypothetical protein PF637_05920 [Spirochaetes bacterium]|jgi:hypothetical protein|nr:hypothetical protein [Spirochaetota bacterium]
MDMGLCAVEITPEFIRSLQDKIGQKLLFPIDTSGEAFVSRLETGEIFNCNCTEIKPEQYRSYEQLGLYWASCKMVADNTEDNNWITPVKVDLQCKIGARLVEGWLFYQNEKTGEQSLQLIPGSISFKNLKHLDACDYFTQAFQMMAEKLSLSVEDFEYEVKRVMKGAARV